ncbi:MAG: RhuM family protein [Rikenellaceae bacterium]
MDIDNTNRPSEVVIYQTVDGSVALDVNIQESNVWLNRHQIAQLFDRDVKTIGKHINNALREELEGIPTVANFATVQREGDREVMRNVDHYNIEMITSIGYRVKSKRGTQFRIWANRVLKEHLINKSN